ncbi:MAG TPA: hypothetical protein VMQ52_00620 [Candidatus Saccharimonadales bacterium]|jgi:hypothetical protein|nr:hypothetical protein [Candidatus Saccharimonadales bacterium]
MFFDLDAEYWFGFPVILTMALGIFLGLIFVCPGEAGMLTILSILCGTFSYGTFLVCTKGGRILGRMVSMPVLYALMVLDYWSFSYQHLTPGYFWITYFLSFVVSGIVTVVLGYHFTKPRTGDDVSENMPADNCES